MKPTEAINHCPDMTPEEIAAERMPDRERDKSGKLRVQKRKPDSAALVLLKGAVNIPTSFEKWLRDDAEAEGAIEWPEGR